MSPRSWRIVSMLGMAVSLAGLGFLGVTADARIVDRAVRALVAGEPDRALTVIAAARSEDARIRHVRGSALLELGRARDATQELAAAAAGAEDPSLRRQALHNLTVAHLELTRVGSAGERMLHARAASAAARDALRLGWEAPGTRWNLALALRLAPPSEPEGSGGPVEQDAPRPGEAKAPFGGPPGELTPEEARRILDGLFGEAGGSLSDEVARSLAGGASNPTRRGPPW